MPGKVYLVGAGPGDPSLVTVRGRNLLRDADVVVVDDLVHPLLLQECPQAKIIYVGKRGPGAPQGAFLKLAQSGINQLLIRQARQGGKIVRLKGGDPLIFGRGGEEMEALRRANISFEVVPGVTSAIAAPAYAGIPLSDRRWASRITFLTGQRGQEISQPDLDWETLSPQSTLVILMGVGGWAGIRRKLLANGWPESKPVAAVESASHPNQRVILTTLGQSQKIFRKNHLVSPTILVVGDVSSLHRRLSWIEKEKPLLGRTVVSTRPDPQNCRLTKALEEKGAFVVSCPAISIEPILNDTRTLSILSDIKNHQSPYDWIIFLSENGVRTFAALLGSKSGLKRRTKIFSVGPRTTRSIQQLGWKVARTASEFNAQGVLKMLGSVAGKRILIPRVQDGPRDFVAHLRRKGAHVDEVATYRTVSAPPPAPRLKELLIRGVDAITFTSGSTVENFLKFFNSAQRRKIFASALALSIGPSTTAMLRKKGLRQIVQARQATPESMVEALQRKLRK